MSGGRRGGNVHSNSPLTALVRTGTLWALLNSALPNPPYCPFPHDRSSTLLIAVPSTRSTVKNAKSPPTFRSMHRVRVPLGVPLHRTTSVGMVIVSSVTFPPRPICLSDRSSCVVVGDTWRQGEVLDAPVIICAPPEHSSGVSSHKTASCASCDLDDANVSQCGNLEESVREFECGVVCVDGEQSSGSSSSSTRWGWIACVTRAFGIRISDGSWSELDVKSRNGCCRRRVGNVELAESKLSMRIGVLGNRMYESAAGRC
jgi:hypothetical protein